MKLESMRRDPRTERILRNRLHPSHLSVAQQLSAERPGPSGLIRRNPHAVGYIGPNGIKRIDRLNGNRLAGSGELRSAVVAVERALHLVDHPEYYVVVVPDMVGGRLTPQDRDVLGQAQQLIQEMGGAGAVLAVIFGDSKESAFDTAGVDRILHLADNAYQGYCPELRVAALAQVEQVYTPRFWLFPDSVAGGFEMGCRLAARLGERAATQVWQARVEHCICRGANGSVEITRDTPRILLLVEECANPVDETRHEALAVATLQPEPAEVRIQDLGQVAVDPNAVSLAEAEFILSAGNGVHDWDQFHQAAALLGATEGASRVAVDAGYMPRFRQVGATGTWVTARVYIAVGISGAVQHLQGIGQCDKVIAINTDLGCDMVKRAALSVIADSREVLAELIQLVQQFRGQEVKDAA